MRIFTTLFIIGIIIIGVYTKIDCKVKLKQCENRNPPPRRQVCGTDNQTYPNRCALLRVQCSKNSPLTVKHRGKCKEKQPCWMDHGKKMTTKNNGKDSKIKADNLPECLADGSYAPVQCHKSTGYCWCVKSNGKIIPGTTVHHRKLECPKRGRDRTRSRNSPKNAANSSKKGCDKINRNIFVKNLLRIFKTEYNREIYEQNYGTVIVTKTNQTGSLETRAVQWKFMSLDKDKNTLLSKNEYRNLRKLIKKVVKPRKCSQLFIRMCDTDGNSVISKNEWMNCLYVNSSQEIVKTIQEETFSAEMESEDIEVARPKSNPVAVLAEDRATLPLNDHLRDTEVECDSKVNDCLSDRKAVLDELKFGGQELYIPECTSDGRYKKVQCYRSTGYCWCVLEESGKPIPGTSVKDSNPKCDVIQPLPHPMKGCPDDKKAFFIKNLMEFFKHNFSNTNIENEMNIRDNQKMYENVASAGFYGLDLNKNKILDRKECKLFRSMMSTNKILRRCGRKFPRYCDTNHDHKININEWLQCLSIQNINSIEIHSSQNNTKRRGPNPIESYLKEDD